MTYLEGWSSILKMRRTLENLLTSGRSNTLRESETWEKVKVKVERALTTNAADDELRRKSRERKRRKKTKRGISGRVPGTQGGRREGRGCAARKGPPGAGPFRPPPFSFLPLPSPRRGVAAPWRMLCIRHRLCGF